MHLPGEHFAWPLEMAPNTLSHTLNGHWNLIELGLGRRVLLLLQALDAGCLKVDIQLCKERLGKWILSAKGLHSL